MLFCPNIEEPPSKLKYNIKTDSVKSTVREWWRRTIYMWSEIELEISYLNAMEVLKQERPCTFCIMGQRVN